MKKEKYVILPMDHLTIRLLEAVEQDNVSKEQLIQYIQKSTFTVYGYYEWDEKKHRCPREISSKRYFKQCYHMAEQCQLLGTPFLKEDIFIELQDGFMFSLYENADTLVQLHDLQLERYL